MNAFGDALAAHRRYRYLTIRSLAALVHYSPSYLGHLETGRRPPTLPVAEALDRAVGADGRLVAVLALPGASPVTPLTADDLPGVRDQILHLAALDTAGGADRLWRRGADLHRDCRRRTSTSTDPDILATVAETAQLAAWLAHDAGRDQLCRRLLLEALATAEAVGAPIRWLVLEQLAMLADWMGAPGESLLHAEHGLALAPTPAVEGMLRMRRARALAELGGGHDAIAEADRAYGLLAAGPTAADPGWAWWLHEPEAQLHMAAVWSATGRHDRAVSSGHDAVTGRPDGQERDEAVYAARFAVALGAAGDWTGVLDVARGAEPRSRRSRAELLRAGRGAPAGVRAELGQLVA